MTVKLVGSHGDRIGEEAAMTVLADHISVRGRFARSANLERDAGQAEPLDGYVVTARALDAVERVASTAANGRAGGAWSLTGPFGSGKSSLALLLDAAFGPPTATRKTAWDLIDQASPSVGKRVRQAHQRHRTQETGFHRGLVTANREPLNHTVLRALHLGIRRTYGDIPSVRRFRGAGTLRGALEDAAASDPRRTGPSSPALVEIARCLAEEAPLLLIIDEFGKNLEGIGDGRGTDPYLLQLLAEAGQGSGLPIFVLTLQHLSFEEYLSGSDDPQQREWAKVHGRFEDIAFVESATATRALIGTVFEVRDLGLQRRIARWAEHHAREMQSLGIVDLADPQVVAACYPLHPLVAMVLPELCSRYGQYERTLFSFLTSPEPASAASFLASTELSSRGPLPSLGLDAVYDYFVASGLLAGVSGGRASRWTEIAVRLRDAHGLSSRQTRLAKAVALINLVSTTGTIRASSQVLALTDTKVEDTLSVLEAADVVTYREFADEYRIWQGTDIDIHGLLEAARQRVQRQSLVEVLSEVDPPVPVVAARHSAQYDVLRIFHRRYANGSERVEPLDPFFPYDGEVLLVVGSDRSPPSVAWSTAAGKPVVAALPHDVSALDRAAREAASVIVALKDPAVEADWVARRELGERLAETKAAVERAINTAFSAEACDWVLLDASGETPLDGGRGSAALSEAADHAYPATPSIHNEMLNRADLTSQGAKARRILLEAMIEHGSERDLGFDGYGPEVAMYRAFLKRTGLHGLDARNDTLVFHKPHEPSLSRAWEILTEEFTRAKNRRINLEAVYAGLLLPPVGMKGGVVPVFVTAALLAFSDEIAIYEHGTFKPLLTPELSERMVRNPGHFEAKHFANTTGARWQVVAALAERLGVRPGYRKHRVANVLAIVGHLVSRMRRLDYYTRQTGHLSTPTLTARDALVAAIEPDELLFRSLPEALGFDPVPADMETYSDADAYADSVGAALDELTACYDQLITKLLDLLLETSAEATRRALSGQAAALEDEVLHPSVRSFVGALANDALDRDADWISAVATVVVHKAPAEWTDQDLQRFQLDLPQRVAAFQRLVALHAQHRADGGGRFDALRVIVTRSDGREHIRLAGIDGNQRRQVEEALDRTVDELTGISGSRQRAQNALLALLGERLLSAQPDVDEHISADSTERRERHA